MASSAETLEAALSAVDSEEAVSETAADETTEETSTEEPTVESEETGSEKSSTSIPKARFDKVNIQRQELAKELEASKSELEARQSELSKLVELLEHKEKDSRIVQKINELHEDPRYKDDIERIDKAVQGIHDVEEQVEEAKEEAEESGDSKTLEKLAILEKELAQTKEALGQQIENESDERVLANFKALSEGYFDEMMEKHNYTEDDINVIRQLLPEYVDWEPIEADHSQLEEAVASGLEATLKVFGPARGGQTGDTSETSNETTSNTQVTPEQFVDRLLKVNWAETKDVVKKGAGQDGEDKVYQQPVHDDATFTEGLAEFMKQQNRRR
jgi:hypothetical protein